MSETSAFRRALCRPDPADKGWGGHPRTLPSSGQTLLTEWGHPQQTDPANRVGSSPAGCWLSPKNVQLPTQSFHFCPCTVGTRSPWARHSRSYTCLSFTVSCELGGGIIIWGPVEGKGGLGSVNL